MEFYLQREGAGELHKIIPIVPQITTIGRSKSSSIVMKGKNISKKQCTVRCQKGNVYINDNGSIHGTFVNSERIMTEAKVEIDDLIGFGVSPNALKYNDETHFVFSLQSQTKQEEVVIIDSEEDFEPFADREIDENFEDSIAKIISSLEDDSRDANISSADACKDAYQATKEFSEVAENQMFDSIFAEYKSKVLDTNTQNNMNEHADENIETPDQEISNQKTLEQKTPKHQTLKTISLYDVIEVGIEPEFSASFLKLCTVRLQKLSNKYQQLFKTFLINEPNKLKRKRVKSDESSNKRKKIDEIEAPNSKGSKRAISKSKITKDDNISKNILVKSNGSSKSELKKNKSKIQHNSKGSQKASKSNNNSKKTNRKQTEMKGIKKKTVGDDFPKSIPKTSHKKSANGKPKSDDSSCDDDEEYSDVTRCRVVSDLSSTQCKSILSKKKKLVKSNKKVSFYNEIFIKRYVPEDDDEVEIS